MCEKHLGYEIKSITNMMRRKLDVIFNSGEFAELTGMQNSVIGYVLDCNGKHDVYQKDIEKQFNIRRSTATVMLQTLEQKGYLTRIPVEQDGRLKKIELTEKAIMMQKKVREQLTQFDKILEGPLEPEELAEMYRLLEKIKQNLQDNMKE